MYLTCLKPGYVGLPIRNATIQFCLDKHGGFVPMIDWPSVSGKPDNIVHLMKVIEPEDWQRTPAQYFYLTRFNPARNVAVIRPLIQGAFPSLYMNESDE